MSGEPTASPPVNFFLNNILNSTHKHRKFRHKGAALTMLWNFVALSLMIYFITSNSVKNFDYRYKLGFGLSVLLYPIATWLADVYVGRYRMLKYSMFLMWVASILYVIAVILHTQFPANEAVDHYMLSTFILGLLGLSGFQANTLQFGVDQLMDASSSDISSYLSWYVWVYFIASLTVNFSQACVCKQYSSIAALLLPVILTICVCSDILFNNLLIKEPVSFYPLKQIFQVLRYAAKNRYPRCMSAITYWEEKPCSRIDLGKDEYGGPFTTEQVEDVKTFFRVVIIALLGCPYFGLVFVVNFTIDAETVMHYYGSHYGNNCSHGNYSIFECYERVLVIASSRLTMVVFIPLFELFLYPMFLKCTRKYSIMSKFTLGIILQLFYTIGVTILEIVGHYITSNDPSLPQNYSVTCMLNSGHDAGNQTLILSFKWIAIPKIFNAISSYCLLTSTFEFVFAQSPYSMKGLIAGIMYVLCVVAVALSEGMKLPFQHFFHKEEFGRNIRFGCAVWYYACVSLLSVMWIAVAVVATKLYSRRKRHENMHITAAAVKRAFH